MFVVITGATSGIGKELATLYAMEKADLVLTGRRKNELQTIQKNLQETYGNRVEIFVADLSKPEQTRDFYEFASSFDPEVVVNNAGFGVVDYFLQTELEREIQMLETNILSLHRLTKWFSESMSKGVILNVASMAGFLPTPKMAAYAASKAYVNQFSNAIDYEMKKIKPTLRVLSLCPGPVNTEFAQVAGVHMALKGISARTCAKAAIRGIKSKKRVIIPSVSMKLTRFFLRFVPTGILLAISHRLQSKK